MIKKVTTYSDFFRALRTAVHKKGYRMTLADCPIYIKNCKPGKKKVCIYVPQWIAPETSLWGPAEVIHMAFYMKTMTPKPCRLQGYMAWDHIGMPKAKAEKLQAAFREASGHSKALRARMCKAIGVKDVPHKKRIKQRKFDF